MPKPFFNVMICRFAAMRRFFAIGWWAAAKSQVRKRRALY
jgi:hypothetical protein